ncbi:MFS transporter [Streptomyces purpurascens]
MPSPYRALFAAPGSKGFSAAGFLGRMPLSMMGIGVVTMVSQLTGRYGLAGALSATIALAAAVAGPQVSRLVDQYGQRRVLRPATLLSLTAAAVLLFAAHYGWPDWVLFVACAGIGCVPSVGAMIRARWAALYRGTPQLHTAYSFESVVDEVCFVFGPIISIGLSTARAPSGRSAARRLLPGGRRLLADRAARHRARAAPARAARRRYGDPRAGPSGPGGHVRGDRGDLRGGRRGHRGLRRRGGAQGRREHRPRAVRGGFLRGGHDLRLLHFAGAPERRWLLGVCAMAVSMIPLLLVGNLPFLAVALFVAGLSIAPTMITTMSLIEEHVPRAQLTEGMTWVSTGLAVGVALGSSAAGWVIDAAGARAGYGVPAVAGAVAVAVGFLGFRRLKRAGSGSGRLR